MEKTTTSSQDKYLLPVFRNELKPFLPDFLTQSYSRDFLKS